MVLEGAKLGSFFVGMLDLTPPFRAWMQPSLRPIQSSSGFFENRAPCFPEILQIIKEVAKVEAGRCIKVLRRLDPQSAS